MNPHTDQDRSSGPSAKVPVDDLFGVCDDAFRRLADAVENRRAAFHTPTLVTVGLDGWPSPRTVVLRGFDDGTRTLRFHTDRRSAKVAELAACDRATVHVYDAAAKLQVRLAGTGVVHVDDPVAARAWDGTRLFSRRCYLSDLVPGQPVPRPMSGLPDELEGRSPDLGESEAGHKNFAVVLVRFDQLDWLYLSARGNRRAGFRWDGEGRLQANWLAP